jgi:hypothetical protein
MTASCFTRLGRREPDGVLALWIVATQVIHHVHKETVLERKGDNMTPSQVGAPLGIITPEELEGLSPVDAKLLVAFREMRLQLRTVAPHLYDQTAADTPPGATQSVAPSAPALSLSDTSSDSETEHPLTACTIH